MLRVSPTQLCLLPGLYFPFCKMESLIPALPQGDSTGSDWCYQIGEAFRNLGRSMAASVQLSAANLLPAWPHLSVPRGSNQTGQGFLDPVLCDTGSLQTNHLFSTGNYPQVTHCPLSTMSRWDLAGFWMLKMIPHPCHWEGGMGMGGQVAYVNISWCELI